MLLGLISLSINLFILNTFSQGENFNQITIVKITVIIKNCFPLIRNIKYNI